MDKETASHLHTHSNLIVASKDTSATISLEVIKEAVHVKAEQDWGDYCSLSHSIPYRKVFGIFSLPSYICHLVPVDVDHQSDNNWRNMGIQKLLEELAVLYCVKSFGTIQKAPIYCTSFPKILINHLIDYP